MFDDIFSCGTAQQIPIGYDEIEWLAAVFSGIKFGIRRSFIYSFDDLVSSGSELPNRECA